MESCRPIFQYLSDLHLEKFPGFRIEQARVVAPFLLLAGDIGDPAQCEYGAFLEDCAGKFKRVFVVLGNHECYGRSIAQTETIAAKVCALPKMQGRVTFLNNTSFDFDLGALSVSVSLPVCHSGQLRAALPTPPASDGGGLQFVDEGKIRVIGTTLWSHVPPEAAGEVGCFVADYRCIDGFSIRRNNEIHFADVKWIDGEIWRAKADGVKLVVLTHHAPSLVGTSAPCNTGTALESAFASELDHFLQDPVALWVHGHTHFTNSQLRGGTFLASNQRGYKGEDTGPFAVDAAAMGFAK